MTIHTSAKLIDVPLDKLGITHEPVAVSIPGVADISLELSNVTSFAQMLIQVAEALDAANRLPPGTGWHFVGKAALITDAPYSRANRKLPSGRYINIRHTKQQFIDCVRDIFKLSGIPTQDVRVTAFVR